jgi:3-phytase
MPTRLSMAASIAVLLAASARGAGPDPVLDVQATAETDPVADKGDAADDPAIWVNRQEPEMSLILATNKKGGLMVYDLVGRELQYVKDGKFNNVDVRDDFPLTGRKIPIVASENRANNTVGVYTIGPDGRSLAKLAALPLNRGVEPYGSTLHRSAKSGRFYFFVGSKEGVVTQYEIAAGEDGKLGAREARELRLSSTVEGMVADDDLGWYYVSEEAVGIWRFPAEPDGGTRGTLVDRVGGEGHLRKPEVEGLTLCRNGASEGYLIASSQGSNEYVVYTREGINRYVKTFRIVDGPVDGTEDTDGIDVTSAALGGRFAKGLFVAQDGKSAGKNQNFKLVPWESIVP